MEKDKELATKIFNKEISYGRQKIQTKECLKIRAFKKDLDEIRTIKRLEGESRHTQLMSNLKYLQERNDNLENQINH